VRRGSAVIAVLIAVCVGAPASAAAAAAPAVSLHASVQQLQSGQPVTLAGQASGEPAGTAVQLYGSPYPYTASTLLATAVTAADGSFSFSATPDRNTRYEARVAGATPSAPVAVEVAGLTITKVLALPLGRVQVTLVVFHPRDLKWGAAKVQWSFASGVHGAFASAPSTSAFALSASVTVLKTTVSMPAGPFQWRACFRSADDQALANTRLPPGCTGRGYHGSGTLPEGYPGAAAIARAGSYLAGRIGQTAFAVLDSEGRLAGAGVHETFITASVVKAMLLVGYLRRLDARGQRHVDSYSNSFLYPMIHVSDNNAATRCWSIVGDRGLYAVAAAAHMTDFSISGPLWGHAMLSPADQARFFFEMDSLIPKEFVGYARFLLSTIEPSQSWAIPAVARPLGYQVFFKDGSEPYGSGQLVHQIARLEGHGRTFSLAVMTNGDPTMQYGIDTIAGVAGALLH
jgi:hypothetical protein